MTMIEMAHARAAELGLTIRVMTAEDGEMLFALEYPEEAGGARVGLAIRVRNGQHTEEAATWLLGQMASAELQHEADQLAADATPLVLELPSDVDEPVGGHEAPETDADEDAAGAAGSGDAETRILTALLRMSILLQEMKGGEMTMEQVAAEITSVGAVLNGTANVGAA